MKDTGQNGTHARRNLTVWVALFFFLVWALLTHSRVGSFNDRSRMAAVESLVHRGTWIIDESPFARTVDRIYVDGHFYSDKPPVLTFIASGVYAVLHEGFHLTLDASWCDLDESPCHCRAFCSRRSGENPDWAYYLLTLALVGLPSALMLALFYHVTGFFGLDNPAALLLTGILGLATQVFPYSTVFNSHIPAAACLLAGFYALLRAHLLRARDGHNPRRWLFIAGLLAALALTFDLGTGLFFIAFFGYAAWETLAHPGTAGAVAGQISGQERFRPPGTGRVPGPFTTLASAAKRLPWPYLLGGLLPIALMALLDYQIVGNPLPPYMYTPGYDYPGSRFPQTVAGNRGPENVLVYGLRLLFGDHGLFALSPVLLWAVVALVRVWRDRRSHLRRAAALVGLTSSLFALYFILSTDNFGGAAYGPRWYTVFIPLLFLFVAARWGDRIFPTSGAAKSVFWTQRLLCVALAAISFANAYQGALNPWRTATPLLWLQHAPPEQPEPVDVALSGVTFEEIDPQILAAFGTRRVDKRWFDARACLVIPPNPTWLFVGPTTPLDPPLAGRSGLPSGGSLTCFTDLRPAWDAYREQIATSAWTSPVLAPSDSDPLTPVSLPADFGGQLALLGYELPSEELAAGTEVVLITAWQAGGKPEPPLSIFVHLLDPQGRIAGQSDGLGVDPNGLRPGDVLLHVHRFTVAPDAPPGRYWLQVGLYNPETLVRLPLAGQVSDRLLLAQVEVTSR
jgi:hypothetical protein